MFVRKCVGAMVFYKDSVLLVQNEKHEWGFPVFVIQGIEEENAREEVLLSGLDKQFAIKPKLLQYLGNTSYEFYSITRRRPVCNEVRWYLLDFNSNIKPIVDILEKDKFTEAGFFQMEEALDMITYSQDKSKLTEAYQTLIKTIYG